MKLQECSCVAQPTKSTTFAANWKGWWKWNKRNQLRKAFCKRGWWEKENVCEVKAEFISDGFRDDFVIIAQRIIPTYVLTHIYIS